MTQATPNFCGRTRREFLWETGAGLIESIVREDRVGADAALQVFCVGGVESQ